MTGGRTVRMLYLPPVVSKLVVLWQSAHCDGLDFNEHLLGQLAHGYG